MDHGQFGDCGRANDKFRLADQPPIVVARYTIHASRMPGRNPDQETNFMKLLVILLTLLSTTIGAAAQQPNSPKPADSPEVELRAFMAELRKASVEGDVDTIANSMTDDYVQTDINGYRQDKTTWLNEYFRPLADLIKAGKFHWVEFERTNLQFRFYGHCAIVTGELHAKATGARPGAHAWVPDPNASFSGMLHFTHVYIKQNGKWMLAALHNQMPLPPADAAK